MKIIDPNSKPQGKARRFVGFTAIAAGFLVGVAGMSYNAANIVSPSRKVLEPDNVRKIRQAQEASNVLEQIVGDSQRPVGCVSLDTSQLKEGISQWQTIGKADIDLYQAELRKAEGEYNASIENIGYFFIGGIASVVLGGAIATGSKKNKRTSRYNL